MKRPWREVDHTTTSLLRLRKEYVEIYLYSPYIFHDAKSNYLCTFKKMGLSGNLIRTIARLPQTL
jgi:hypothetical protein